MGVGEQADDAGRTWPELPNVWMFEGKGNVDELNGYVILGGVALILALIAYAGYTDLLSRIRKWKGSRRRNSAAPRRR